jgi:hypothetical protein
MSRHESSSSKILGPAREDGARSTRAVESRISVKLFYQKGGQVAAMSLSHLHGFPDTVKSLSGVDNRSHN